MTIASKPASSTKPLMADMADDCSDLLDNLFHSSALQAYIDQAQSQQSWPCPEATKQRAYRYYEAELAIKNGR